MGEKGNFICVKERFNNLGLHRGDSLVTRTRCKLFYNLDFIFEATLDCCLKETIHFAQMMYNPRIKSHILVTVT